MKTQSSLLETKSSPHYLGLIVVIALSILSTLPVSAAHGGWGRCGGGGCRVGWYPSHRNRRYYGRRGYRYSRSPMDLVQEFLEETPLYVNSLLRQQQEKQNSVTSDDEAEVDEDELPQKEKQPGEASLFSSSTPASPSSWFSSILPPQTPRFEIFENEEGVVEMAMEVPGMPPKDLSVELENDTLLRIRGFRSEITNDDNEDNADSNDIVHQRETELLFEKVFEVDGDMDVEHIEVFLTRGILTIRIPKKVKVVKRIPIMSSSNDGEDDHDMIKATVVNSIKKKKKNMAKKSKSQRNEADDDFEITDDENNDNDENWQ